MRVRVCETETAALAGAILLAVLSLSFTNMAQSSTVLSPA